MSHRSVLGGAAGNFYGATKTQRVKPRCLRETHSPGLCLMLALDPHLEETLEMSTFLF